MPLTKEQLKKTNKMSNLKHYRNNQLNGGLNKRCGWICKALDKISELTIGIPFIGPRIGVYIADAQTIVAFIDNNFLNKGGSVNIDTPLISQVSDYEPTATEAILLDAFTSNFGIFFKAISIQLSGAFANNDFNYQLAQINEVMAKICVIKQHFTINQTEGLSTAALKLRTDYINISSKLLEDLISNSVKNYSSVINLQSYSYTLDAATAATFGTLMKVKPIGQTYNCQRYVDTEMPNNNPVNILPGTTTGTTTGQQVPGVSKQPKITLSNVLLASSILLTVYQLTKEEKKPKK